MAKKSTAKKDTEKKAKRQVVMVTTDDGRTIKRAEYIRELFQSGMKMSEIAKKLGIPYQYVWQATRKLRQNAKAEEATETSAAGASADVFEDEEEEEQF